LDFQLLIPPCRPNKLLAGSPWTPPSPHSWIFSLSPAVSGSMLRSDAGFQPDEIFFLFLESTSCVPHSRFPLTPSVFFPLPRKHPSFGFCLKASSSAGTGDFAIKIVLVLGLKTGLGFFPFFFPSSFFLTKNTFPP